MAHLQERAHIQDHSSAKVLQGHWGYPDRVLPCTNDAGSCEYLDGVYWMHDVSMLFTFILWAVIGACQHEDPRARGRRKRRHIIGDGGDSGLQRGEWLLRESLIGFFGHVTRLQILALAILLGYLLISSLLGIVYKTWVTPIKNSTLHKTPTGLGGFADRVGALAHALIPLTVALSTRESILTLLTGILYQSFNFIHRWLGRIIFIQSFLHTLGWIVIEEKLYQPQPWFYREFINETNIVWSVMAMALITFLYIFSLERVIKWTGHEFFRKTHYIVASICIGFWFHPAQSTIEYFDDEDGGVVRLEFKHNHDSCVVGQDFFLCFLALTISQSHPFTVASIPTAHPNLPHHTYIARYRKGETNRLKTLALTQEPEATSKEACVYHP